MKNLLATVALAASTAVGRADRYWIAYDGDDFPENQGWTHLWNNPLALRSIDDGALRIDASASLSTTDYYQITRPGALDPGPGEAFVMQWGLEVIQHVGFSDLSVGVFSDASGFLGFGISDSFIFERPGVMAFFAPGSHIISNCAPQTCEFTRSASMACPSSPTDLHRSAAGRVSSGAPTFKARRAFRAGTTSDLALSPNPTARFCLVPRSFYVPLGESHDNNSQT